MMCGIFGEIIRDLIPPSDYRRCLLCHSKINNIFAPAEAWDSSHGWSPDGIGTEPVDRLARKKPPRRGWAKGGDTLVLPLNYCVWFMVVMITSDL